MPDAEPTYLRIHCLCGQRMKVSGSMYGLPGKCVACRLKIRIPRRDEVPAGVDEIHLKDHPEFVRKRRLGARATPPPPAAKDAAPAPFPPETPQEAEAEEQPTPADEEDLVLGELHDSAKDLPLDVFDYLRRLCSLEYVIDKNLAAEGISSPDAPGEVTPRNARDLLAQRQRALEIHADLSEELRQRLLETAIELASTQEKLGEAGINARVGRIPYGEYAQQAARLRERRERLERQQHNLRAWLRLRDPFLAGGLVEPSSADPSVLGTPPPVPQYTEEIPSVLDHSAERLRAALQQREAAERALRETRAAREKGELSSRRAALAEKEIEDQKRLADAAIAFYRGRLEQLRNDYRRDLEILTAQQDLLRSGHRASTGGRSHFESRERELLRGRGDCAKAIDLVERVLSANLAQEVPHARGTFLGRLGVTHPTTPGRDAWTAWAAALLLLGSVFLPLAPGLSTLGAYTDPSLREGGAQWTLFLTVLAGVAAGLAAGVPVVRLRAVSLLALWSVVTITGVWLLREAWYTPTLFAAAIRSEGSMWSRPAFLCLAGATIVLLAGAIQAAVQDRLLRWIPVVVVAATVLVLALMATNAMGSRAQRPLLQISAGEASDGVAEQQISVRNGGARAIHLLSSPLREAIRLRNGYLFTLQQRIGQESWRDVTGPLTEGGGWGGITHTPQLVKIEPGQQNALRAALPPGDYRVLLQNMESGRELVEAFAVATPAPPAAEEALPPEETAEPGRETPPPSEVRAPAFVEVELRGVVTADNIEPMFRFAVHVANGRVIEKSLTLDDTVYGAWVVREYNPQRQTVVLSDGVDIITVRRGERAGLP